MRILQHITVILALLAISCTGSKKVTKKALKLSEAGMYSEAAGMYLDAVRRNRNNTDAKIGLKQSGQKLLNDKLSEFFKASNSGQKELAVDAYLDSERYKKQVAALGVLLNIPAHYKEDFDRVKGSYLLDLYEEGQELMDQERYKQAEAVFSKIGRLDPNFKDANSLQSVAFLEPLYKQAKTAFDLGHFRAAYADFDKIVQKDASFKDAYALREDCIVKGRYTIAIPAFKNSVANKDVTNKVSLYALNEMANINDPFIKVVDRDNMDRILKEQELALSGVFDDASAVEVGNLLGAQAVLIGEVVHYKEYRGAIKTERKIGYLSYKTKVLNKETNEYEQVTRYKRTAYHEYKRASKVTITVNYKLISMETGEILFSKVVDENVTHNVHYAKFEGDRNKLFPAKNDGKVNPSNRAQKALRVLMSASQQMPSVLDMRNQVVREACGGMAYKVRSEVATRIQ